MKCSICGKELSAIDMSFEDGLCGDCYSGNFETTYSNSSETIEVECVCPMCGNLIPFKNDFCPSCTRRI